MSLWCYHKSAMSYRESYDFKEPIFYIFVWIFKMFLIFLKVSGLQSVAALGVVLEGARVDMAAHNKRNKVEQKQTLMVTQVHK